MGMELYEHDPSADVADSDPCYLLRRLVERWHRWSGDPSILPRDRVVCGRAASQSNVCVYRQLHHDRCPDRNVDWIEGAQMERR
jgi:hypothetical protein